MRLPHVIAHTLAVIANAVKLAEAQRFERDGSGYHSRAEMAQCGCDALDKNGDLIPMPAQFLSGKAATSPEPSTSTR
ncbi:MAG TPA: hypothetical protein VFN29_09895 [Chiayiivirga sp.]|nr:hypothetical protein [Chiayiivirga sp.]